MALNSYAAIQAELQDIIARADLSTQIVDAITLFEAEAAYELFRTRGTEVRTILVPSNPVAISITALADNGAGLVRVTYTGTPSPALATGNIIAISNTSAVDGSWVITVISSTQLDLQNSGSVDVAATLAAYSSGGTFQQDQGFCTLPSDYLGWRRVTYTGVPTSDLEYVPPNLWDTEFPTWTPLVATDIPRVFTVEAGFLKIKPVATTPLEFVYWQQTPALSGNFNWLVTNRPDAYIAGCLAVLYGVWIRDFTKAALYTAAKEKIFQSIKTQRFREFSNLHVRLDRSSFGATP